MAWARACSKLSEKNARKNAMKTGNPSKCQVQISIHHSANKPVR